MTWLDLTCNINMIFYFKNITFAISDFSHTLSNPPQTQGEGRQGLVPWWWLNKLWVTELVLGWQNKSDPALMVPWGWSTTFCQLRLWSWVYGASALESMTSVMNSNHVPFSCYSLLSMLKIEGLNNMKNLNVHYPSKVKRAVRERWQLKENILPCQCMWNLWSL